MRAGARQGTSLSVSSGMRGVGAAVSARGRTGNNRSAGGRGTCRKGCLTIRERCSRSVKGRRGREWFLVLPTGRSSGGGRDVSLSGREMQLRGLSFQLLFPHSQSSQLPFSDPLSSRSFHSFRFPLSHCPFFCLRFCRQSPRFFSSLVSCSFFMAFF